MSTPAKIPTQVTINASTVQCGDIITVGGRPLLVIDLTQLRGGMKRMEFFSGEILTIHTETVLTATRQCAPARRPYRRQRGA
ncbi:hypothetical protein ACFV0Z_00455 [Streptomyces xiamenensis]|uniref:hypothetical protein n=1 Tax=Streptomyces xiamenensis TaxID=408015 RepID=UPI0036786F5B